MKQNNNRRRFLSLLLAILLTLSLSMNPAPVHATDMLDASVPLSELSTKSLVDEILSGKYSSTILCFSRPGLAYKYLKNNYEIFTILESRPDAVKELYEYYSTFNETEFDDLTGVEICNLTLIGALFSQPIYSMALSEYQPQTNSLSPANSSYVFDYTNPEPYFYLDYNNTRITYTLDSSKYMTTPRGCDVWVYSADRDFTFLQKISLNNLLEDEYDGLTRISTACSYYNCHSYAWYSTSTNNDYWISYVDGYVSDTSYEHISKSSAAVNDIVVYFDSSGEYTHSAIITSVSMGSIFVPTIVCASKMGAHGVYSHSATYLPDEYYDGYDSPQYIIIRPE